MSVIIINEKNIVSNYIQVKIHKKKNKINEKLQGNQQVINEIIITLFTKQ